jgi:hypothetical protein
MYRRKAFPVMPVCATPQQVIASPLYPLGLYPATHDHHEQTKKKNISGMNTSPRTGSLSSINLFPAV